MTDTVLDRLLRYVVIDTQSDASSPAQPSTEKQKDLGRVLVGELLAMGLDDAHMDEHGNVYATVPSNTSKDVPVICFCSHMDTAPDFTGTNVKPNIVKDYQGGDIQLTGDTSRVIRMSEHPELRNQIGHDIVTTDGTTLLGADDKAGIAEIMTAAQILIENPDIKHGAIRLLFTTDEEIGRGADKVDLAKLGAAFGYTLDGSTIGEIEDETFSADGVEIEITGVAQHPGTSKGVMENAIKIAADIIARLPKDMAPETTDGRQGFIHPTGITGSMDKARLSFIIRDFVNDELTQMEALLQQIAEEVLAAYPGSTMRFTVTEQYRNMKEVLDRHPEIMDNLMEAARRVGLEPVTHSIRGGTDGSRLSFMGLPCPNIYTGGHSYHSPLEWISRQDMEKSVATIVELVKVWEERA
ncbi:MAG: peptidase T [Hoeflea sp.]|uniref:peptidase T n=1 Tax=Hoeflea sp. TaxID=1940281 RepID=UPI001D498C90|nr:peptidase T [Hoeflea sp.]MBU4530406.1 peptidase T [Alphaproteobacteria bacterium]MBU4545193.1 peptidase T [Alphaproteobacteria bacterium]MBU4549607.1 peptidase T [Alphaproteobacteria bacterium]MBV1721996.1 peptidase T [Hoeflea sp.]MBV1761346.1 peptidase T [Hoeflea sp.]